MQVNKPIELSIKKAVNKGQILQNIQIAENTFKMVVNCPAAADTSKPGQFINVRCSQSEDLILRRPFSICSRDRKEGNLTFAYEIRGKGTNLLSHIKQGELLDFLGPLGNGFSITGAYKRVIAVGGGIGVFPLLFLLQEYGDLYPGIKRSACLGFRDKAHILMEKEFAEAVSDPGDLHITTDDGSYSQKGHVTCAVEPLLKIRIVSNTSGSSGENGGSSGENGGCGDSGGCGSDEPDTLICACGPAIMLKNVARLATENNAKCEVSLEERMGCGIGACLVCACAVKDTQNPPDNGPVYKHVCNDGPVFNADDVNFLEI